MDKFEKFRLDYPVFEYVSYDIQESLESFNISYNFVVPGLQIFKPSWQFPKPEGFAFTEIQREIFERTIFNLGMIEVISYLKATCSPRLVVKAGTLNKEQIMWYKKLYINGLGEFFYTNKITEAMNIETFLEIEVEQRNQESLVLDKSLMGNLIPVGGGKDSLLTLEILMEEKDTNLCYIVNPRGASYDSAKIAGYEDINIYTPKRIIDTRLIELNKQGFLNGHTPFSAILAFSSYAAAIIMNKENIILSNESSANEANVSGTNINHQYSKSIEFENDFREYIIDNICKNGPNYFSLLRPLSEWQIVKNFIKSDKYFKVFKSCNVGSKQDIWCENCSKCLYVYIMLAAFLNEEDLAKIFTENMLDNMKLKDVFNGLVYQNYDKPFECVGTKEEINLSIKMIIEKYKKRNKRLPKLLEDYEYDNSYLYEEIKQANANWEQDNNLDKKFIDTLKKYIS